MGIFAPTGLPRVVASRLLLATGATVLLGFGPVAAWACTVFAASGSVTEDGRPVLCKIRDTAETRQILSHVAGSPYDYIGVRSEDGNILMGLNEKGVAIGNSLISPSGLSDNNARIQMHILQNKATLDEVYSYVQLQTEPYATRGRGAFPVIDAVGNAGVFELSAEEWWLWYDTLNSNRQSQGLLGFVVRANEFHQRADGTDRTTITGGRYQSGTANISGLVQAGNLSARTVVQGGGAFEFARYGPGRTMATISRPTTVSAMVVHGVAPGEDPALATMWVILGQSNYGIAVPAWVAVSDIPGCLADGSMYDRARSLYEKGGESAIQGSILPAEARLFDAVNDVLLPHWRAHEAPSVQLMMRVETRMAMDAYSLMDCLDNLQGSNKAPEVSIAHKAKGFTMDFASTANDTDGTVQTRLWDFGDQQTSSEPSPSHVYSTPGDYLVSCTVADDDGVYATDWRYVRVPMFPADLDVDGDVDADDCDVFAACRMGPDIAYDAENVPSGCTLMVDRDGWMSADLDRDSDMDQADFAILQRCLSGSSFAPDPSCAD
jgi:hypothetical protein